MDVYAVILAGGRGERFWPASRRSLPKQFLSLAGPGTLLQQTVSRIESLVPMDNVIITTSLQYEEVVRQQIPTLPADNIITEPCSKNTAPAVTLSALTIGKRNPKAVMMVFPADHYIADEAGFRQVLKAACTAAAGGKWLVTIGIMPTRPETGYGYINTGKMQEKYGELPAFKAQAFVEKPDQDKALAYIRSGNYLWNSGMFIWRADLIGKMTLRYLPEVHTRLAKAVSAPESKQKELLEQMYPVLPSISIDYGIMEKTPDVLVLPGDFGWDDVGSWTAVGRLSPGDDKGNVIQGRGVAVDAKNCIVKASQKRAVALLGVEDVIVVDDKNCLLVCRHSRAQDIKKVLAALKEAGCDDVL